MRHAVLLGSLSGVAAAACLVAGVRPAPARPPADGAAALTGAAPAAAHRALAGPAARTVRYRGVRVPVPPGWAVHRLDRDPARCVRYDRHAIYLGRPGPQPDCPARVVGRTEAVHVAPLDGPAARASEAARRRGVPAAARSDAPAAVAIDRSTGQETRLAVPAAGVMITGVYGADPERLQDELRGVRLVPGWDREHAAAPPGTAPRRAVGAAPTPPPDGPLDLSGLLPGLLQDLSDDPQDEPPPDVPPPHVTTPHVMTPRVPPPDDGPPDETEGQQQEPAAEAGAAWARGRGFDTCTAPSLATMRAWRPSFDITNVYIGGAARGCAQPNLTASWVRRVRAMGYRVTPTYVGHQAPCGRRPQRFTARDAAAQGARNATDAARRAGALGIPRHRPIYFDMEAYRGGASCRAAVLRFVDGWVRRLRAVGYTPCLYSSAASGVRDVGRAAGISKPGCVWFANWDGRARLYGDPFVRDEWWRPHRRIKQYRGPHRERHGGVTLNIDSDLVDGRVH